MIVPATPLHAAALAAIHAAAFPPGARWGRDAMSLQLASPAAFGFIDAAGGCVLARVAADEAEVLTLAVMPHARRAGLARGLLAAACTEAARRGAAAMLLEVGAANVAAQALYAGAGFCAVGRRRGYYGGTEDALVLRAALRPSGSAA